MARYDPPQPFWKRALAGVLDLFLAYTVSGLLVARTIGSRPQATEGHVTYNFSASGLGFDIEGWPAALVMALTIAYFVVLGRTGGTVFQRLFGMRRAA